MQRVIDVLLAFPLLILALAIVTVLGRSVPNVVMAIAIPIIPRTARIVRSNALSIKENMYVEGARALGSSHPWVILRHIIPNVMAPYLIMLTAQFGNAILVEASLSFLGLGTAEPTPVVGTDALRERALLCREGGVGGRLPRPRHQPGGLRLQPLRRFAPGRPRPQAPPPLSARADPGHYFAGRARSRRNDKISRDLGV